MFRYGGITVIHRLDPRAKIVWLTSLMVIALIVIDPLYLLPPLAFAVAFLLLSRVYELKEFHSKWIMSTLLGSTLLLVLFNGLFAAVEVKKGTVLFYISFLGLKYPVTVEGFYLGVGAALRLLVIMLSFLTVAFTTYPRDLANSLEKVGLPYELTFTVALTFRFIPFLEEEARRIADALKSRGYRGFEEGGFLERLRAYSTLFTVLIVNSLSLVRRVGMVLEARCFGASPRRSSLREYRFRREDYLVVASSLLLLALYIVLRYCYGLGWLEYAHGYV
ncbi:energy-coupling factor transporter transmembrane component T family protein [Thermofilum pendens]|uniref:Cobalt transport protein n=1 Tax=Thermofilum pendens (strain DSM 2475 / Hrk 5) TaxID=368408 RepID=A1S0G1_THEPD|nr:energy-coupling factor transporter transmembrane component T [Thermofilum pendens]ABL78941.1 cobalt transport protein [Thermofilum pendens Hrk 5]